MGGIISPQKGDIQLKGKNFDRLKSAELDKFREELIGRIQETHFVWSINVLEYL